MPASERAREPVGGGHGSPRLLVGNGGTAVGSLPTAEASPVSKSLSTAHARADLPGAETTSVEDDPLGTRAGRAGEEPEDLSLPHG